MQSWVTRGLVVIVLLALAIQDTSAQKNVVCYYSSWATYRPGDGKFDVETIDPFLCTHVIYAFVGLNWDGTVRVMDTWNELDNGALTRFTDLKKKNPNLKTLLAIGGWNEGSVVFSQVASSAALRSTFVTSAYNFLIKYGFNGLDVDWEYPAQRGGSPADKTNFVSLLKELNTKFAPAGLILSVAVAATVSSAAISYNIPEIVKYVDFVNLMTYDYHGSWESAAGIHSPLYPSSIDTDLTINADATVRYWIQQGAPAGKLLLGGAMYGRSYTLRAESSAGVGAPISGPGGVGPYTQEAGFLGYNEICELTGSWNVNWAAQQKVPFAFKGTQWIGYDNVKSIQIKAEYAKMKGLGGMLVWGIETDDFRNKCGQGKFPLINGIKSSLNAPGVSPDAYPATQGPWMPSTVVWDDKPTTTQPTTTTTQSTTTKPTTTTTTQPTTTTTRPTTTTTQPTTTRPTTTTTQLTTTTTRPTTTTTHPTTTTTQSTTTQRTTTQITTTKAPTTTTLPITTSSNTPSTTTKISTTSSFQCSSVGYFRDPAICSIFYYCQAISGGYNAVKFICPADLVFDNILSVCNYPQSVKC